MKRAGAECAGFTLIELLVTLALVGLVIVGGFRLYIFANNSFVSGTIISDIQTDIQLAMGRITNELGLAHSLAFVNTVPDAINLKDDDHYLFVQDGLVVLRTTEGNQILTSMNTDLNKFKLSFSYDSSVPNILGVQLTSLNSKAPYSLDSSVQLLNLRSNIITGDISKGIVYFTKSLSIQEREDVEMVRRRCVLSSVIFDDDDPGLNVLRGFRDEKLKKTKLGQNVIRLYYSLSPYVANSIEKVPAALLIAKVVFRSLVFQLRWRDTLFSLSLMVMLALGFALARKRQQV